MASTNAWAPRAAGSFVTADGSSDRARWSGRARLAVIGSTIFLSWLPLVGLGYACSKLIG